MVLLSEVLGVLKLSLFVGFLIVDCFLLCLVILFYLFQTRFYLWGDLIWRAVKLYFSKVEMNFLLLDALVWANFYINFLLCSSWNIEVL